MSPRLHDAGIAIVLLDVEGTTTPITFVHDVLFPYARARVRAYLEATLASDREIADAADLLRDEHMRDVTAAQSPPDWLDQTPAQRLESIVHYVYWLMDRDRKSQPLKVLQGKIWERGYAAGELRGEVYPDVRSALERWAERGVSAGIFSSGSVLAQKLLFGNSTAGDLTPLLRWHFDTEVGAKVDAASYGRIIEALRVPPREVLFVSDVSRELDAAGASALRTALCVRDPATPPASADHPVIRGFDEVLA